MDYQWPYQNEMNTEERLSCDVLVLGGGMAGCYAAIAAAVHLYMSDAVHDNEPLVLTIRHKDTPWETKSLNFRKSPRQI